MTTVEALRELSSMFGDVGHTDRSLTCAKAATELETLTQSLAEVTGEMDELNQGYNNVVSAATETQSRLTASESAGAKWRALAESILKFSNPRREKAIEYSQTAYDIQHFQTAITAPASTAERTDGETQHCIACPVQVRGLYAVAFNLLGLYEGDHERLNRKLPERLGELRTALNALTPIVESHFNNHVAIDEQKGKNENLH